MLPAQVLDEGSTETKPEKILQTAMTNLNESHDARIAEE